MTMLLLLLAKYLLIGCPIALLTEWIVVTVDSDLAFTLGEKMICIALWPLTTFAFGFYFVKGMMEE